MKLLSATNALMNTKSLFAWAAVTLATSSPISAAPINLDFELGSVSGTFFGLDDEIAGRQMATSFTYVGGLDTYFDHLNSPFDPLSNVFEFANRSLTKVDFDAGAVPKGLAGDAILGIFDVGNLNGGFVLFAIEATNNDEFIVSAPVTFTTTSVAAVPLPASGMMLIAGFLGLAGVARRQRNSTLA